MSLTLNELSLNEFEDHSGRPGQRGGSLPRSGVPGLTMKVLRQQASLQGKSVEQLVDEAKRGEFQQVSGGGRSSTSGPAHRYAPPPPVLSDEEVHKRLHYALKSSDPLTQVKAKSAKALLKSSDTDIQRIARQRVSELPRPSQSDINAEIDLRTNPLGAIPPAKDGESFSDHALRALSYGVEATGKLGRATRGVLSGKLREAGNFIPFSDTLGITRPEDEVSGRDLLEKLGMVGPNVEGFDWGDVGGQIVEGLTDPLMYIGGIGAIRKSAQVDLKGTRTLLAREITKLEGLGHTAGQAAKSAAKKAGKTERAAKMAYTRAYKDAYETGKKKIFEAKVKKAKQAKPVSFGFGSKKPSKAEGQAAAAQAQRVAGGMVNPAAAAMLMLKALERSPIGGELLRRLRKRLEVKAGKVVKQVRDTEVPKSVRVFGKDINTGVKKKGTTIGQIVKKANTKVTGNPQVSQTIDQVKEAVRYANQAHLAGSVAAKYAGVRTEKDRLRQRAREEKATKSASMPMMITQKMKQQLRDMGFSEADIRLMKPEDAWKNLGNVNNTLVANFYGGVRKAKYQGKDYLVAPLSLIVEGVLNGSKGALHYPMTEMKKSCQAWNNTPIVVYHPMDAMGRPQRAKGNPDVLNRSGIGVVRNARISGNKLVAEGWFDLSRTQKIDSRVYNALLNQQKMELSTGLDTDNEQKQGVWNGRNYVMIARNYRPDHLAILPDQIGACSVQDGCGLMVANHKRSYQKPLVRNCHCNNTCQKCKEQSGYVINPFVSEAQRRYMYAKHPNIAKRWTEETKKKGESSVQPEKKKKELTANSAADLPIKHYQEALQLVANAWSDEARAAALEARRRRAQGDINETHEPQRFERKANEFHRKAMQTRRGGFLKKPNEEIAKQYDHLARTYEEKHQDPEYHKREAFYHKQYQLEQEDLAQKASGSYVSKAGHATIRGVLGGIAGSLGGGFIGKVGGKLAGRAVGSAIGSTTAGTLGGLAGATAGGLLGGGPLGAAAGGIAGSALGRASGRLIGSLAASPISAIAGRTVGQGLSSVSRTIGAIGGAGSRQLGKEVGEKLGATLGSVTGSVLGGTAGSTLGAMSGYRKGKEKAKQKHLRIAEQERTKSEYHKMALTGLHDYR